MEYENGRCTTCKYNVTGNAQANNATMQYDMKSGNTQHLNAMCLASLKVHNV